MPAVPRITALPLLSVTSTEPGARPRERSSAPRRLDRDALVAAPVVQGDRHAAAGTEDDLFVDGTRGVGRRVGGAPERTDHAGLPGVASFEREKHLVLHVGRNHVRGCCGHRGSDRRPGLPTRLAGDDSLEAHRTLTRPRFSDPGCRSRAHEGLRWSDSWRPPFPGSPDDTAPGYRAPRPERTVGMVRRRILASRERLQLSM